MVPANGVYRYVGEYCDAVVGMSMEDIREYESRMHSETNKIVRAPTTTAPESTQSSGAVAVAGDDVDAEAGDDDEESPSTPSNTPTDKSAPFQFPDVDSPGT